MTSRVGRGLCLVIVLGVWAVLCREVLRGWALNADEGFYLAASRAVSQGLMPYRDFAFTQMPLLPCIDAPLLRLVSGSLWGMRLLSMVWTAAAIIVAHRIAGKRLGFLAATGCFALFFLCTDTLGFLALGKTYALAQFLFLCAALPLFGTRGWRTKLFVVSVFGAACVGVRLTMAPSVAVLWAGLWVMHWREAGATWMIGVPVLLLMCLLGPFFAADPAGFTYFNWVFHWASAAPHHPPGFWAQIVGYLPVLWVLMALAAPNSLRRPEAEDVLFWASVCGVAANLLLAGTYAEYLTPFVLPGILGSLLVLARSGPGRLQSTAYGAALVIGSVMLRTPPASTCVDDANEAARFLEAHSKPSDQVLASMPEIAVQAGRPLFRTLVMGKFTVTGDYPPAVASRLRMIHISDLVSAVERREPAAIVLSSLESGNFLYSLPSNLRFTQIHRHLMGAMLKGYSVSYSNATYVILLPREHPLAAEPQVPEAR